METTNIMLKRVPKSIILALQESTILKTISQISREIDATYAQTHKILIKFKNFHWITMKKSGREQLCQITEEGKIIAKAVELIVISGEEFI